MIEYRIQDPMELNEIVIELNLETSGTRTYTNTEPFKSVLTFFVWTTHMCMNGHIGHMVYKWLLKVRVQLIADTFKYLMARNI